MRASDVRAALRSRFSGQEWAIFFEVADGTGTRKNRSADAVAMNLWPSRGLELHGFEIKVSRSDWLSELKNPAKSEPVQRYCDRWWIVCPADIIKPGELPPTWGHYEVSPSGQITQKAAAPKLESVPATRDFMAALMRRVGSVDEGEIEALVSKRVEALRAGDEKRIEREIDARTHKAVQVLDSMAELSDLTGIDLTKWNPNKEIAAAIKMVLETGALGTYGGLAGLAKDCERMAARLNSALAKMTGDSPK